ncbi:MAG TPA: GtrA family protein [Bosea sp. (in: a-proteobacteria)]|jgi:putative flippase GtrA|uniref:GtrA family protein n=1 Tax=Bosea sp. (in: a-proteobacteria) TaxID=1871050 RepID=UPI002E1475F4|nr:GtrA family protein [Bosea sp. (in: a-proteobacteria)]
MATVRDRIFATFDSSFLRFFLASLFGLCFDLGLAGGLHYLFGLPLIGAAVTALMVTAFLMYFVHEFWTFRSAARRLSLARMMGTVTSALLALAVRAACLYGSSELMGLGDRFAMLQFVGATGVSFLINYGMVQRIIARRADA